MATPIEVKMKNTRLFVDADFDADAAEELLRPVLAKYRTTVAEKDVWEDRRPGTDLCCKLPKSLVGAFEQEARALLARIHYKVQFADVAQYEAALPQLKAFKWASVKPEGAACESLKLDCYVLEGKKDEFLLLVKKLGGRKEHYFDGKVM